MSGRGQNISFKSLPKIKKVAEWDGQDAKPRSTGSEEGDLWSLISESSFNVAYIDWKKGEIINFKYFSNIDYKINCIVKNR